MPNYLNVPAELLSLIEKRELDERRRTERRANEDAEDGAESLERRKSDRRSAEGRRRNDA